MTFLRVMVFSVAVLLVYTMFANILPQVQSNPPADDEPIAAGSLDMNGMVALGEKLFSGKGTCTLCHNNLGRAPDLLAIDLNAEFRSRLADPNYKGKARGLEGARAIEVYLRESMHEPSAYVVAGFGKKGSNDTVSPMPVVNKPPIGLSEVQIDALIAFLMSKGGFEITVELPGAEEAAVADSAGDGDEDSGPAETARAAIEKFTCNACHDLFGSEADAGPDLHGISKRMDRAGIVESILKPNAKIAGGFEADLMPQDFAEQMRVSELNLIVDYLMTLKKPDTAPGGTAAPEKAGQGN